MTALSPQSDFSKDVQSKNSADEAHLFRSKLIDKLSVIESWACEILQLAGRSGVKSVGQQYLFGQKLKKVRELACAEPPIFNRPEKLLALLDRLQPYADMRSSIAHAMLEGGFDETGRTIFIFETACADPLDRFRRRVCLRAEELGPHLKEIGLLANQISQRKLLPSSSAGSAKKA